ncbi:hypothetical protein DITRI_Ditri09bG0135800 [Diplodiscus trichospermus]
MERAHYWMWMRRHEFLKSHFHVSMSSLSDSWEEKAFAEDAAAGFLGGCIWPPRSYSCSFCRRQFRSAQALGGHMNVHRRDRAKLKQSLDSQSDVVPDHQNPNPKSPHDQAGTLDHSTDDLDNSSTKPSIVASAFSASRVSDSKPESQKRIMVMVGEDSMCLGSDDHVETNLSVGLSSVFFQNRPTVTCGEEAINYKRPKIAISSQPFLVSQEKYSPLQPASSMDNLDLELRLGVLPKVK